MHVIFVTTICILITNNKTNFLEFELCEHRLLHAQMSNICSVRKEYQLSDRITIRGGDIGNNVGRLELAMQQAAGTCRQTHTRRSGLISCMSVTQRIPHISSRALSRLLTYAYLVK